MSPAPRPQVLVIGVDPATLDPVAWGVTAEHNAQVVLAIAAGERDLHDAGYDVHVLLIALDADLEAVLIPRLRAAAWDCVVVGGGLRKPESLLLLFERVVNAVHRHAQSAAIAFNSRPSDLLETVRRCTPAGP
jgi:hypothetical protein